MKKIWLILLFAVLLSCAKDETLADGVANTTWTGRSEDKRTYTYSDKDGTVTKENTITKDVVLKFIDSSKGTIKIATKNSNKEFSSTDGVVEFSFTYTYDLNYRSGKITYDLGENNFCIESTFEIRDGFLYEYSGYVGEMEYYRK